MVKEIDIVVPPLEKIPMDNLIKYLNILEKEDEDAAMYGAFDLICGIPKEQLRYLSFQEAEKIYAVIQDQLKKRGKLRRSFIMDGIEYAMIPNLETASVGEYADMDSYITPLFAGEIKHQTAFKFMRALYRPLMKGSVDGVYAIEKYAGTDGWQLMKKAPSDVYINSVAFFLNLKEDLLNHSLRYSLQELKAKNNPQMVEALAAKGQTFSSVGGGLEQLIALQVAMLHDGMRSLNFQLPQLSPNLQWSQNGQK